MPRPDAPPLTRGVVLRAVGLALAVALGAVAVWLIVTSHSQKKLELGVLAGLWGLLLGAFTMFGSRRVAEDAVSASPIQPGSGVELRSRATELERADDVAARRAHEARIEEILRQEIRGAVTREVSTLRAEIAQLRTDLLEKVGGQLRLERIETTRVIGSDLEALQDEVRALKSVSRDVDGGMPLLRDLSRARARSVDAVRGVESSSRGVEAVRENGGPPRQAAPPPAPREPQRPISPRVLDAVLSASTTPAAPPRQPAATPRQPAAVAHPPAPAQPVVQPATPPTPQVPAEHSVAATEQTGPIAPIRVAEAPKTEAPKTEAPKTEAPKTEAPKTDTPKTDTPKADTPKADTPKADTPKSARRSEPNGSAAVDVFADLPRLTPFVDDSPVPAASPARPVEPAKPAAQTPAAAPRQQAARAEPKAPAARTADPGAPAAAQNVERPPSAPVHHGAPVRQAGSGQPGPGQPGYEGRRRRTDGSSAGVGANGVKVEEPGGRRRRVDETSDDLLARLLARESH